jgi:cardiolipin synthase
MHKAFYYIVNILTGYRLLAAPLLIWLVLDHQENVFKWMLALSFSTDAVDGFLARKYRVTSKAGAVFDSIADDLTVSVAILAIILWKPAFLPGHIWLVSALLALFVIQVSFSLARYGRMSSFHTYAAKIAAVSQGGFLVLFFFLNEPADLLFYITAWMTIIELAEEIVLVILLPRWQVNVKGIYWLLRDKLKGTAF